MYVCMYVWWLSHNTWYCLVINREPIVDTTTKLTIYCYESSKCPSQIKSSVLFIYKVHISILYILSAVLQTSTIPRRAAVCVLWITVLVFSSAIPNR